MQQDLLWAFVVIFTVDSISPGPAVAMVVARGASIGVWRTLPFIAGLVVGDLILFGMALLGLVALAQTLGPLFFVIKWIGICYLLYLAYSMWNAGINNDKSAAPTSTGINSFLLALLLPLGNPKAVGFYVALLPAFMDIEGLSVAMATKFSVVIVVVWSLVLTFYAALADNGRRYTKSRSAQKWLNRGSAGAMVGVAGAIAFRS